MYLVYMYMYVYIYMLASAADMGLTHGTASADGSWHTVYFLLARIS